MCFSGPEEKMPRFLFNPAAYFISWLMMAVAVQVFDWTSLAIAFFGMLLTGKNTLRRWWQLIWRAKWLLLTLCLVLAYGTPGDLWRGIKWAPSMEGMDAAGLHVMRLLLLLGSLAWLFQHLPHQRFVVSLWVLMRPIQKLGWDADQTVARLALVFDYLEQAPAKGTWRHFLETPQEGNRTLEIVKLEVPRWHAADSFLLLAVFVLLLLLAMWS